MARIFRSLFFIGAIYGMSPIDDGLSLLHFFSGAKDQASQQAAEQADKVALAAEAAKALRTMSPEGRQMVNGLLQFSGSELNRMAKSDHRTNDH